MNSLSGSLLNIMYCTRLSVILRTWKQSESASPSCWRNPSSIGCVWFLSMAFKSRDYTTTENLSDQLLESKTKSDVSSHICSSPLLRSAVRCNVQLLSISPVTPVPTSHWELKGWYIPASFPDRAGPEALGQTPALWQHWGVCAGHQPEQWETLPPLGRGTRGTLRCSWMRLQTLMLNNCHCG